MAIQAAITEHCGFNFDYAHWADLLRNGAVPNYFVWRQRIGLEYEDERGGACTAVDAGILRTMREQHDIRALWDEWVRKTIVVDRRVKRRLAKHDSVHRVSA